MYDVRLPYNPINLLRVSKCNFQDTTSKDIKSMEEALNRISPRKERASTNRIWSHNLHPSWHTYKTRDGSSSGFYLGVTFERQSVFASRPKLVNTSCKTISIRFPPRDHELYSLHNLDAIQLVSDFDFQRTISSHTHEKHEWIRSLCSINVNN